MRPIFLRLSATFALVTLVLPIVLPSAAQAADEINSGDTAWLLTSTALVLFMTIPGLALFYGGLVRARNVLSILMQCFSITALVTVLWMICGYTLAFDPGTGFVGGKLIGGLSNVFLANVKVDSVSGSIPETVFVMFQMTFAIITPALIIGAFAERMKFSACLLFMALWLVTVYCPVCHWVWGGGWIGAMGAYDFAGGTVVHINAGIAGLVACLVLGPRKGFRQTIMPPHSLTLTVVGASMLWVGWFGFNAGSQLAADGKAGMAMLVTQIACAAAALAWMFVEWLRHGKPSVLGIVTGAVAGLVAITPASGFVGPMGALLLGIVAGVLCFFAATTVKMALGYDDALDAFGVHGVGGFIGAVLTGLFCAESFGGAGFNADKQITSLAGQLAVQTVGALATVIYSGIVSYVLLVIVNALVGLRVSEKTEIDGLDISEHDERGYNY